MAARGPSILICPSAKGVRKASKLKLPTCLRACSAISRACSRTCSLSSRDCSRACSLPRPPPPSGALSAPLLVELGGLSAALLGGLAVLFASLLRQLANLIL